MRALVQVVTSAAVTIDDEVVGSINEPGLLVLVGVTHADTVDDDGDRPGRLSTQSHRGQSGDQ